jgi:RNA polymerase sigma factor (sigma-70 family)
MAHPDWPAERFEADRRHLHAVAYRMLGSPSEADDAVQETWLRLNRSDTSDVQNLTGWLTTVTARVCLDMLRARRSRREEPLATQPPDPVDAPTTVGNGDPEHEVVVADSVGAALLVVLDTLAPAERIAFVLHDLFDLPFEEIAPIVDRSPAAARQLASRARRRVRGADGPADDDLRRRREIVAAFLAASRAGDFDGLLALLDPDAVVRADPAAQQMGATLRHGAREVAETFSGRAQAAVLALVGGTPGAVWSVRGEPRVVFGFTVEEDRIVEIEMIADATRIDQLEVVRLTPSRRSPGPDPIPSTDHERSP